TRATLPAIVNVLNQRGPESARPIPPRPPEPPLIPGDIGVTVAPRPAPAVIIVAVPGLIVIARSVNHRAVILIRALVARCVTDLDLVIVGVIHARIRRIINRRIGWDGVNLLRNFYSHQPRAGGCRGDEPNTIFHRIIIGSGADDGELSVD